MRYIWVGYVILFWLGGCAHNRAYDAYQQKDFVTAAREYRLLAEGGDVHASYGRSYTVGFESNEPVAQFILI
jgi:hypothetical protein